MRNHHTTTAALHNNALHGQRPPTARDVTHQLWCINHIPANSPGYLRILPDKEVKSPGTVDCRKFSCCRLVDLPVQPTCVITSYSKEWFPRRKLLRNFTVHSERSQYYVSERSRQCAAFLHCLLLSHRRCVVYTAHTTHSRALRFVHDSIALLRTAPAVTEHKHLTSLVPYIP